MKEAEEEAEESVEDEEAIESEEAEEAEEIMEEEKVAEEAEEEVEKVKGEEVEEEIVEERVYTIPLRRAWISPRKRRAPRAIHLIKSFIQRHMKIGVEAKEGEEAKKLVISNEVNERIWSRGIEKPPPKIRVRAVRDKEGTVTLYLAEGD